MTENGGDTQRNTKRQAGVLLALILLTGIVFSPVAHFDFVNLDDDVYVTANAIVQKGLTPEGIAWAFTTMQVSNWHPLTWLSHMLDCQLFGVRPGAHHMVNLILHVLAASALFLVLAQMTGTFWNSAFVAALFAIHPLHVESVAWIAERKDVLSGLMWMLTLAAYAQYAQRPGWTRYLLVIFFFVLGLLSKPMIVTLPFVLLLLDYWPLRRFDVSNWVGSIRTLTRLVLEKTPLIALSAASCVITVIAQWQGGSLASTEMFPFHIRLANAVVSYVMYIVKTFYPVGLAVSYPHPGPSLPAWQILGAACVLIAVTVAAILLMRRFPYLLVGWLWYLGTLAPVIGLVQVGSQAMADRYTYVPLIGLFIMLTWGLRDFGFWILDLRFGRKCETRALHFAVPAGAVILLLSVLTALQASYWRDSVTLFEHALRVTEHNSVAHNNLGTALMDRGRYDEAAIHFSKAFEEAPSNTDALNNLGVMLLVLGKPAEAASVFTNVLERMPTDATVESNLGVAFMQEGNAEAARQHLMRALELDPNCDKARQARALLDKTSN